jgi:hypothetical protein
MHLFARRPDNDHRTRQSNRSRGQMSCLMAYPRRIAGFVRSSFGRATRYSNPTRHPSQKAHQMGAKSLVEQIESTPTTGKCSFEVVVGAKGPLPRREARRHGRCVAPKGQDILAQGNALGNVSQRESALKGRDIVSAHPVTTTHTARRNPPCTFGGTRRIPL